MLMTKTTIQIVMVGVFIACANMAEAQWTSFLSQRQNRGASWSSGTTRQMGGTTYYNNANGSSAGMATRMGNTTYFNNSNGSSAGSATTMGNTTYYNNANGSSAGSATTTGW